MAAKILANLMIAGGTVLFRAASQAYRQAIINGSKAGMTAEGVKAARAAQGLTLQEAQQILDVEAGATWEEIMRKYTHLFDANQSHGSFYLQSKVYRARERLAEEFKENGWPMPEEEAAAAEQQQQQQKQQEQ